MTPTELRAEHGGLIFRLTVALVASLCAGAAYGFVEGLFSFPAPKLVGAVFNAAITGSVGLGIGGAFFCGMYGLFGADGTMPQRWLPRLLGDTPAKTHRFILTASLLPIAIAIWAVIAFHATRLGITRFHHMGLAALLVMAITLAAAFFLFLLFNRIRSLISAQLELRYPGGLPRMAAYLAIAVGPIGFALVVALSPESGEGVFGFLGLLKREALDLGFLRPIGVMILGVLAALTAARLTRSRVAIVPAGLITGAVVSGMLLSASGLNALPSITATLESDTALSRLLLPLLRRPFDRDRDGASRLFGGGDCDDHRGEVNPSAIDIAGNGVDEDCSGADAVPLRANGSVPAVTPVPAVALRDNLSVLYISVDALRYDVGTAAYRKNVSPTIEALAKESVVFEKSWAMSSFTGRAIGPFLLGRYPSEAFCNAVHLPRYHQNNLMLAEMLKDAGVQTAAVHAHPYFKHGGLDQGFDRYVVVEGEGGTEADLRITGDQSADATIAILNDKSFTDGRFFLWVHFMDPHKEYLTQPDHTEFGTDSRGRYDGEVAFTDVQIGRVLDALAAAGLSERTAIVFTADHGEAFGEHGVRFHGRALWEEIVRVPWFWRIPGMSPRHVETPVGHINLVPSVLSIFKVEAPQSLRGTSLLPLMISGEGRPEPIYIEQPEGEYMPPVNAVIDWPYKLIHTINGNRYQLFDLQSDPLEKTDLAGTRPEILEKIKSRYSSLRGGIEYNADRYKRK